MACMILTGILHTNSKSIFPLNDDNYDKPTGSGNAQGLLNHRSRVTHKCIDNVTLIGSHNGLSPGQRQAIIWASAGILLIGPLGSNFNEISIKIHIDSFKKMHLKMLSGKWRPFCLGLNGLIVGSGQRHLNPLWPSVQIHICSIQPRWHPNKCKKSSSAP